MLNRTCIPVNIRFSFAVDFSSFFNLPAWYENYFAVTNFPRIHLGNIPKNSSMVSNTHNDLAVTILDKANPLSDLHKRNFFEIVHYLFKTKVHHRHSTRL